jgi:hypothetical protein
MHEERTGGVRARRCGRMHRLTSEPGRAPEKRKRQFLTPRGERLTCNAHGTTLFTVASRPQPRRVRRARDARPTLARYRGRTDTAYSGDVRSSEFDVRSGKNLAFFELRTSNCELPIPFSRWLRGHIRRGACSSGFHHAPIRCERSPADPSASTPCGTEIDNRRHNSLRRRLIPASLVSRPMGRSWHLSRTSHTTCRRLPGFNGPFTLHHSGYEPRSLVGAKHSSAGVFPSSNATTDWHGDSSVHLFSSHAIVSRN